MFGLDLNLCKYYSAFYCNGSASILLLLKLQGYSEWDPCHWSEKQVKVPLSGRLLLMWKTGSLGFCERRFIACFSKQRFPLFPVQCHGFFFHCNLLVLSRPDDDWYLLQWCNCFKSEQRIDKERNLNQSKVVASQNQRKDPHYFSASENRILPTTPILYLPYNLG